MKKTFPEQIYFGDLFNGTLRRRIKREEPRSRKIFAISEFPQQNEVKTLMGWLDLPCLNYEELREGDGKRYRFEVVEDRKGVIVCRALEKISELNLNYESPEKEKFRQELEYKAGQERIVVPSKSDVRETPQNPRAVFYEPYFPDMTGFIYFNMSLKVRELVGKRVLVKVNKIVHLDKRIHANTEFLRKVD